MENFNSIRERTLTSGLMLNLLGSSSGNTEGPSRYLRMGFVNLGDDRSPRSTIQYPVLIASDPTIGRIPYVQTPHCAADITLLGFYCGDLPDLWQSNEGLLKLRVSTRDPKDLDGLERSVAFVRSFRVRDQSYAPSFLFPNAFRNIIFTDQLAVGVELYELDTDLAKYYQKAKSMLEAVPEVRDIDVLRGIPYLDVATKLVDSAIRVFGRNPDDYLWGDMPALVPDAVAGVPYLRTGIYVIYEADDFVEPTDLSFVDGTIRYNGSVLASTHLIVSIRVKEYRT